MPTPDDAMVLEHESIANRATCPPEDPRSIAAHDLSNAEEAIAPENVEPAVDAPLRRPTPTPDTPNAPSGADDPAHIPSHSHSHTKSTGSSVDAPQRDASTPPTTTDDCAEYQRASQASPLSTSAPLPASPHTGYLTSPFPTHRFLPNSSSSLLRPGSRFKGSQTSDRQQYEVEVEVKHIDMRESFMCGYLRIKGLTEDHPSLTTYFEGEIIGSKYTFITQHPEWGSNEKVDRQHWARFPAYKSKFSTRQDPVTKDWTQKEHLFMRWKEYFLVPDHRVRTISGASFEGFYYICFNQVSGGIEGIYFHAKSEKFQKLQLEHVQDHGCRGAIEFR